MTYKDAIISLEEIAKYINLTSYDGKTETYDAMDVLSISPIMHEVTNAYGIMVNYINAGYEVEFTSGMVRAYKNISITRYRPPSPSNIDIDIDSLQMILQA